MDDILRALRINEPHTEAVKIDKRSVKTGRIELSNGSIVIGRVVKQQKKAKDALADMTDLSSLI